ncbi:MAG: right-handed parallel beta-helix repeat-containing protein, partial [Candidatus Thermoplasmatota archaeon]|nr:right-handed parallel beta-helix repeat-containing protein [Candidatus Thermoplasmatota archaeon]
GLYATKAQVVDDTFMDSDGIGLVAHTSEVTVENCTFSNMTVDIRAMYSDIRVKDTVHDWTFDEALFMYRSDFNISGVRTNMSYWGLRTYASSGICSNLTTAGAGFSVYLERSWVTIEGLRTTGYSVMPGNRTQRAIFAVYSELKVSNVSIEQVRSGLVFDSSRGLVEDVRISNCTHQGVVSMWSTWLVLRNVTVINATAGFHTTLYNNLVFEDCLAENCRDVGYNLSAYDTSWLVRCKVVNCPIGVWMYRSMTRLVNCSWDMISAKIGDPDPTYSVRSILSYTYIEGGTVVGGDIGFGLTSSSTRIKNVTFRDVGLHCIDIIDSWRDIVEGCTFIGHPNGTAIVIIKASPTIRDNLVTGFKYGLAVYRGSDPLIEGNVVWNITNDGIQVFNRTRATLRGNHIYNCGEYGLHVAFYAEVVCRDDVIEGSGSVNIFVHTGASIDLQGAKVSGSRVGLHGVDSPKVRVAYCEFRDNNRGVLVSKVKDAPSMVEAVEVVVEGTYFVNHSGYCIGILDGDLEVIDCNLLDNGAGVVAWNSTVDLVDNSMVRCWLFGLRTYDSSVRWTVQDRCRLYGSNLIGEVDLLVDGGVLEISDSKVELAPGSSFRAAAGSSLAFQHVTWTASGSVFTVVDSEVDLLDVAFDRVGPLDVSSTEDLGVSISGSNVSIVNSSFENALGGITLVDCMAWLYGTHVETNALFGVLFRDSTVVMGWCEVKTVGLAYGLVLEGSTLNAENVSVTSSYALVHATGSSVELTDCSLDGGTVSPLVLWDSSA